jgi:glycosyltransferase involved in cell wall biosynthesis
LAKSWGIAQTDLVKRLLASDSGNSHLLQALQLVIGEPVPSLAYASFSCSSGELRQLEVLHANRCALVPAERAHTVNDLLRLLSGGEVAYSPVSAFQVRYESLEDRDGRDVGGARDLLPLVSVLVTAYNCAVHVRPSIQSLLEQTHSNLQILVANDASTDATWSDLALLEAEDPRVRVFNLPENIGTYGAKSLLLKFAAGEFVICHDIDDLADPRFIERSLSELQSNARLVAVMSGWFRIDEELRIFPGAVRRFWPLLSMNFSSLFLRTDLLRKLGGWDVPRVAADSELFERLKSLYGSKAVGQINAALTIGSMRSDSLMNHTEMGAIQAKAFRTRVAYRESFIRWHDDCKRRGVRPVMPSPVSAIRPYAVPNRLRVSHQAIARCYESMLATSPVKPVERV